MCDTSEPMKDLALHSQSTWPKSLPSLTWNGWRLTRSNEEILDLSDRPVADVLRVCFPILGLASLSRLASLFPDHAESVFAAYDLRWSDRLAQLCERLGRNSR